MQEEEEIQTLYEVAKQICHVEGLPWTGVVYRRRAVNAPFTIRKGSGP